MKYLFTAMALAAALSPSAQAEDILSLIERSSANERPQPPELIPYNYTVDVMMNGKEGGDEAQDLTASLLIDPSAPAESRVTIVSVTGDAENGDFKEFLEELRDPEQTPADLADEFWCEGGDNVLFEGDDISTDGFTVISETETEAIIKPDLQKMASIMMDSGDDEEVSKSERKMMEKMMKRLDGEFVVSKPDLKLKRLKIWMTRPMTMKVIAKLKQMEITQSCAIAPNGFSYTDGFSMHVKAKALGVGVEQNMNIKITGLTLRN